MAGELLSGQELVSGLGPPAALNMGLSPSYAFRASAHALGVQVSCWDGLAGTHPLWVCNLGLELMTARSRIQCPTDRASEALYPLPPTVHHSEQRRARAGGPPCHLPAPLVVKVIETQLAVSPFSARRGALL